jgi:hypothetical protein
MYSAVSPSVVYLEHQIFLSSSDCAKPDLWKRFEKLVKTRLLDAPWPLASGSGFFLDNDGTILTNRHVAKLIGLQQMRDAAILGVAVLLDAHFSSSFLTEERASMTADFKSMISKGRYSFHAMVGAQDLGAVRVVAVASEKEPDLAVLKAPGGPYKGIRLAPGSRIGPDLVGTSVLSFGYPLGSDLDVYINSTPKERAVTMNQGTISAFRRIELSLQHSAAISHGNSGGPLLDREGLVLGVNTAGLEEEKGNSLFYAIDAATVGGFLGKRGLHAILLWNQRLPAPAAGGAGIKYNALGELECSADVILDTDKSEEVLLDGTTVGSEPQFLHLVNPISSLELRGPREGSRPSSGCCQR